MKSILYWEFDEKDKSVDAMRPIYYQGPFWAFWLIEIFSMIAHLGWDISSKIEDRFTFKVRRQTKNVK